MKIIRNRENLQEFDLNRENFANAMANGTPGVIATKRLKGFMATQIPKIPCPKGVSWTRQCQLQTERLSRAANSLETGSYWQN